MHWPFTVLPDSNPVGHYFNALYQTGFYYEFIGWSQIIATVLLLLPRTAHIGSLMFLPIIVNIAVLTCSIGLKGTWLVTIFMSLLAVWLTAWEYDRLKPVLCYIRTLHTHRFRLETLVIPVSFAVGGVCMAGIWAAIGLGNFPDYKNVGIFLAATGFLFGIALALHYRFMPIGELEETSQNHLA